MSADWPPARQVTTHLGEIEYRDIGEGPVLVFLHLVLAAGDHWDKVVARLSNRYRCIVPDLPMGAHRLPARSGADLSPPGLASAVAEALDRLGVNEVTLVGNDTGGAIAQLVAARHGERVARLVLTDCDLYDEFLEVHLLRRHRDERKFSSVAALVEQIHADVEEFEKWRTAKGE